MPREIVWRDASTPLAEASLVLPDGAMDPARAAFFLEEAKKLLAMRGVRLASAGYTLRFSLYDAETAGTAVTWNAEYGYAFNDARTRVYALAGSGFRAPDATDRYGYGGNPDLEPERSRNFEVGVRHALTDRHSLELSAFQTDIEDLVEYVVTDFETYEGQNQNVAEARVRGVEAGWRYERG